MKLWKKALSLALCLCLVLSLMPALAPVEAEAASVPTYISGIYFAADKNQSTAKNAVKNAGYTLIDYDLNKGCGASSKYIYMGYKTTSDPSQAITGIFFSDDIKNPAASYTFPYNGKQITANKVSDVDLNSGASGDYIFAYTTTDLNFGNPVTTIQIKGNNSINAAEADGTWTIGRQIASGALYGTDGRNLNAATLGDKIYLHYKQAKALEAKAYFYQMGAQDAVSTVCTSYSGTVYDNYNTIEAKPQILQEVSLGGVTYRFAGWREDTNGYVVTTTKPQMGADKVRYYYAIYDFDITVTFDSDGGNGAPDSFTVTSRAGAWQGTIPPGSTLPFFPISQEGVTVTLPTTVPTKEGTCGFRRWVRICDGTTVEPGGKILMTFARYYSQMRAEYLSHGDSNGDGFCDRCDTPIDKPSVSNGAYQISTKAQLAWFMQKVNKGETSANAVLVNDIDMGGYEWTPITSTGLYYKTEGSDKGYAGTFDGAGYTISNFKITASTTEEKTYGLFGTLSGTVKNLGIRNVTYNFPNGIKDLRAAGIVGQMLPGSTVTDCFVVDSSIAPGKYIVGGVAACNYGGTIANCYTKNVTVKGDDRCGNLVSDTRADNSETDRRGTVINCYTDAARVTGTQTGNLTSNCEAGVTADRFASGEIAYRLGQAWGQTLGKDALPTPGKAQVYYGYTTCHRDQTAPIYTNQQTTAEKPGHRFNENYICTVCELVCTHTEFAGGTCLCGKITGGYCGADEDGKNLIWTLVDGLLTISGEGAMKDFSYTEDPAPWQERCEEVTSILIEDGVTYLGIMSFPLCTNLTEVQLPDSLEGLGYSVFNKCEKLASIIIPEKVTEIPHHAFYACHGLKSVTFEGKITTIEHQAFQACTSITSITLPDSVVSIGDRAFRQTLALEEIVIPDSVTSIGIYVFYGCSALKNVTIGKNLTQMGDQVFYGCTALDTLTWLAEGVVVLGADVFANTNTPNIDLLLTYHHADEITDGVNWNGFTFKSIQVLCVDGTVNHTFGYTTKGNATHEMTCTLCGYAATEACSGGEGTATCINRKVCDLCQAPYGELNPNNHAAETYTNGFLDCCGKVYEPATGSGTESDPYKIGNAGQLYWFAQQVNGGNTAIHGKLVKNILINENVLAEDGTLNEGQFRAWTPMGNKEIQYTGTFDGDGKTISGLYFNNSAASDVGLFSYVGNGGIVKNVGIQDSYVSGRSYVGGVVGYNFGTVMGCDNSGIVTATGDCVGGVAGYNKGGTITGCHNSVSVSGRSYVGGVAGDNYNGTVMGCHNSGSVSSTGDNVGGVVGENNLGTVTGCDNSGSVSGSGSFAVGGVTGYNNNGGTVTGCRNSGSVSDGFTIGGVVGYSYDSTVTDSYNTGSVSGSTNVGGVVGYNSDSTVTDCYNSGTVSGNTYVGGVVGQLSSGTVTNCYYDSTVCSADAIGYNADGTVTDVMGKTTEQFASGEVAYLLSQGCTVGEGEDAVTYPGDIWGQNINGEGEKDAYPVFSDAKVYQILNCNNEPAGYSNTESDALCHNWKDADCDTPKTCTGCGTTEGDALGHDWTDADCDTPKTCNRCGETEGEALGHSWNDATCTDPKTCSVCGETEGEALGHKLVDRICTVCNKMPLRIEMTNIDATGWNGNAIRVCEDGQLIATVTLAEDKTGDIWYYLGDPNKTYEFYWVKGDYCGGCGFAITIGDETVMIAFADVNMEYADGIRIYPACEEHDYRLVKVHEPTCDLWGYTLYVCTVCGESKEDDYVPSLGHTIAEDAVGVVTPPTCENDGYTTYECDRCGESFNALYLPALPHTLGEDGLCSVCGQPYTVPVWVAGIQIDANNLTDVLGDGTVSYDPSANVLTLNGFVYEGTDVGIYTAMSVNIVLLGENTIYTEDYGILSEATDGEITIRGTGTLTINSATVGIEMYHYGQASLVIGGSVTVSAYAEDAEGIACYSEMEEACVVLQDNAKVILGTQEAPLGEECVYVKGFTCGSFTIEDNASISGITTDEEGIYVGGDQQFIVISDNASVYFCADKEALDANTIRISGGTVTAIGGEGYEGIYADELTITGGTVTVSTVEVEDRAGDGVEADCITITGGTLKILSGGLIASMDGGETNVPGTITLGEGVVIASPAGAVLGQFDLTAIGEGMVLAVLDAEGNFADSLIIQFCVHEWADADCDTPKTCILCGATEGEPLGHSYENDVCTICGHIGVPVKLDSASLSFEEKIHYNIFFSLGLDETVDLSDMGLVMFDSLKADGTMDDAIAIYAGAVEMDGKYMVATDGVPAKYMGDTIYFRVYAKLADGSYVYSKTVEYSAVTYAEHIFNSDKPESAKALVVAMLNYGAAAQMFFGYNTDNLVNTFLNDEQKALPEQYRDDMANTVPVVAAEKQGIFANNKGFNKRVPAVSFEGAFEINYFFTPAYAPVDGITLYYWTEADFEANEVLTVDNATGSLKLEGTGTEQYRGDIGGIAAKNLSENIYVAAIYSDGTTTWTSSVLGYSIGAYCGRLATNGGTIADLAMATAVYGYHAKAYFG